MDNRDLQSFKKAMKYNNSGASNHSGTFIIEERKEQLLKRFKEKQNESQQKEAPQQRKDMPKEGMPSDIRKQVNPPSRGTVSGERLQEAIIWSEILGKPLSKRKNRTHRRFI